MYHTGLNIHQDYGIGAYKGPEISTHKGETKTNNIEREWKLGLYKGV